MPAPSFSAARRKDVPLRAAAFLRKESFVDAQEIIDFIATAPKKTPVKLYVHEKSGAKINWGRARVYGGRKGRTVFGDWSELEGILRKHAKDIKWRKRAH